ncbi:MAG: ZIP family metal transporter [Nanoarchaeota archaeon]|nr:ZIP family metal transporter [Nanoarchaeota archaeon]
MNTLLWIFAATMLDGFVALIGIFTLLLNKKTLNKIIYGLVAFSAGALFSGALLHMIPETLENASSNLIFGLVIFGFSVFYLMERLLHWHHCHEEKCEVHSFTYLILFGDGIHNFIDGLIIAAGFSVSIPFGIITTLLIIGHEIPQELGDFGVLLYGGFKIKEALLFNYLSQLTCVIGGIVGYIFSTSSSVFSTYLLPFAAGGFIYISASDLIPSLHTEKGVVKATATFVIFVVGVLLMAFLKFVLH